MVRRTGLIDTAVDELRERIETEELSLIHI